MSYNASPQYHALALTTRPRPADRIRPSLLRRSTQPDAAPASLRDCLLSAFDAMAQGTLLLYANAALLHANPVAHALLRRAGWMTSSATRFGPLDARQRTQWQTLVRQVCVTERRELLALTDAEGALFIALTPVIVDTECLALATLGRQGFCGALELQFFASRHGLSPAEHTVLQKLAMGQRPADIAQDHAVAEATVKSQIMSIRQKTRASSVQDLLRQLAGLPAMRPALLG